MLNREQYFLYVLRFSVESFPFKALLFRWNQIPSRTEIGIIRVIRKICFADVFLIAEIRLNRCVYTYFEIACFHEAEQNI